MKVEGWLFLGCGLFFDGTDVCTGTPSTTRPGTTALALGVWGAVLTR